MDDDRKAMLREQRLCCRSRSARSSFTKVKLACRFRMSRRASFSLRIVIVVDAVKTDDLAAGRQQALGYMKPDKAGSSGDQYRSVRHRFSGPDQSRHNSMSARGLLERTSLSVSVRKDELLHQGLRFNVGLPQSPSCLLQRSD